MDCGLPEIRLKVLRLLDEGGRLGCREQRRLGGGLAVPGDAIRRSSSPRRSSHPHSQGLAVSARWTQLPAKVAKGAGRQGRHSPGTQPDH